MTNLALKGTLAHFANSAIYIIFAGTGHIQRVPFTSAALAGKLETI